MTAAPMTRFRRLCLTFPEAYEEETWDTATFRIRKKIFAMAASHDGSQTVTLKSTREEQAALLESGGPYFYPSYVGSKGWIGIDLSARGLDWGEVSELVTESYRLIAPKRLSALLP